MQGIFALAMSVTLIGILPLLGLQLPQRGDATGLLTAGGIAVSVIIAGRPELIYPAIDISDDPPGKRFVQVLALPVAIGLITGLAVAVVQRPLGL